MNSEELELTGKVIGAAAQMWTDAVNDRLPDIDPPEFVLAEVDDDDEAEQIAFSWIQEARDELERRERTVREALELRMKR